jgi:hypothetical protein
MNEMIFAMNILIMTVPMEKLTFPFKREIKKVVQTLKLHEYFIECVDFFRYH